MSVVAIAALVRAVLLAASLRWDAPPECPDAATVTRRVFGDDRGSPVELEVVVTRDPGGYRLRGELRSAEERQHVALSHGGNCDALVDKLKLHMASLLDEPRQPAERPRSGYLRVAGGLDAGSLRMCRGGSCARVATLAGGTIAGGWRRGRLRVELGVPLLAGQTRAQKTGDFGDLAIRWYGTGAQLRLCGALERRKVELLACGELGVQLLVGDPRAESDFRRAVPVLVWTSMRLILGAVWWMHPQVGLRLEAAPGVNLRPFRHRVYDVLEGQVARRPLVEAGLMHLAVGLGVDLRFGGRRPGGEAR